MPTIRWRPAFVLVLLLVSQSQYSSYTLGALLEDWQTVVSDTTLVWKLFGPDGPQWLVSSHDCTDTTTLGDTRKYSMMRDMTRDNCDLVHDSLPAHVPGDLLSDLQRAGLVDDPYINRNFLSQRSVWMGRRQASVGYNHKDNNMTTTELEQRSRTWIYECTFELPPLTPTSNNNDLILIVEGIKMGASIRINNVLLGNVTDQFLRFEFPLNKVLSSSRHAATTTTTTTAASNSSETLALDEQRRMLYRKIHKQQQQQRQQQQVKLTITFDPTIETNGRFQACSGGWDWAPYTRTGDQQGSRTFSFGIWKPIYIVQQNQVSITHVVPKIYYLGDDVQDSPRSPMRHGPLYDFRVDVDVHLSVSSVSTDSTILGAILLRGNFSNETASAIVQNDGINVITLSLLASKDFIQLWWPLSAQCHGLLQPLYTLQVSYQSSDKKLQMEWINRTIGFRTLELITINDTDGSIVNESWNQEGSGNHGMFFRVNGLVISARGANVVPMDQLEGRLTEDAHAILVQSAAEAGMNMLRVWGGGMIMPPRFYQMCDQLGILVYHDLMLVEENHHGARNMTILKTEIRHMVQSLATHPSIVLWSGCNECVVEMDKETSIYATLVMQTVAEEDLTRPLWPSCPSSTGWKTGVTRINGRPNGKPLSTYSVEESKSSFTIEKHGPYRHGTSRAHPSVNSNDDGGLNDTNIPPDVRMMTNFGPEYPNQFISEFGVSTWSSFESISATLSPDQWSLHGSDPPDTCVHVPNTNFNQCQGNNVLAERNYACDSLMEQYFGKTDPKSSSSNLRSGIGEKTFKAQLYQCVMASTLWLKGQIEIHRGTCNSFGTLVWQLNENWPTGGWGLLEYGSSRAVGQSVGGRWKPAMHLLKQSLFRDVFATCGKRKECFIRNDGDKPLVQISIVLETMDIASGDLIDTSVVELPLLPGTGHVAAFQYPRKILSAKNEILLVSVRDSSGAYLITDHIVLWTEPMHLVRDAASVVVDVVLVELHKDGIRLSVTLESDRLAMYVVLTSGFDGHFNENSFVLRKNTLKTVFFAPPSVGGNYSMNPAQFCKSLRVEHLLSYLHISD